MNSPKKTAIIFILAVAAIIATTFLLSPAFSASNSPCGSCHGSYSQYLDFLEGASANKIPTTLNVGQTVTISVLLENRVNAPSYTSLTSVTATLASQNGRFSVNNPTINIGTLAAGTRTLSWQITGVSTGTDSLVLSASGRNSHQSISHNDNYSPPPTITISNPAPPPPSTYTLTIQSSQYGKTTPSSGVYTYNSGSSVTLTATPNSGYKFDGWNLNGATSLVNPLTLTVTSTTTAIPNFSPIPPTTYKVIVQPSANGATNPASGTYSYASGAKITLAAIPNSGYMFDSWTVNGVKNAVSPLTITISADTTIAATFQLLPPPIYTLVIEPSTGGATTPTDGTYTHISGSQVTLTAFANSGYQFENWIIDGSTITTNPLSLTITADTTVKPAFAPATPPPPPQPPIYSLSVQPSQNGTTNPPAGTYTYSSGSTVNLTATPKNGFTFKTWEINGQPTNKANPLIIIINSNIEAIPIFEEQVLLPPAASPNVTVAVRSSPDGTTTPASGTYSYPNGSQLKLTAIPKAGYEFSYWMINGLSDTTNPIDLSIASDIEVIPVFKTQPLTPNISDPDPEPNPVREHEHDDQHETEYESDESNERDFHRSWKIWQYELEDHEHFHEEDMPRWFRMKYYRYPWIRIR